MHSEIETKISNLVETQINSFLYCWTDHKNSKLYVGVRKGWPGDGYVCSSKIMLQEYNERPNDFTRQIIAQGNYSDLLVLETYVLKSVDAKYSKDFYNMHNGDGKFYNKKHTEETKRKQSISAVRRKLSIEEKLFIKNLEKTNNPHKLRGYKQSAEHITKRKLIGERNPMFGRKHSSQRISQISFISKNSKWYIEKFSREQPIGFFPGRLKNG